MDSNKTKKIIEYFGGRPEVVAVYVFGSYAKDCERPSSDIDLGIILKYEAFSQDKDFTIDYTVDLGRLLRKDCHIVNMNRAGEGLLTQIFRYGKCLFMRDPVALSRFKSFNYSLIADFGYHRSIMDKAFLSRYVGEAG